MFQKVNLKLRKHSGLGYRNLKHFSLRAQRNADAQTLFRACLNNGRQRIFRLLEAGAQCAPYRILQERNRVLKKKLGFRAKVLPEMNFQTGS